MAPQTTVRFIDDLDGSDASGTFDFSLEGRTYGRIPKSVIEAYQAAI